MRHLMQPTKKETRPYFRVALGAFLLGMFTAQMWLVAIAFFPLVSWWGVLVDPEAPEEEEDRTRIEQMKRNKTPEQKKKESDDLKKSLLFWLFF